MTVSLYVSVSPPSDELLIQCSGGAEPDNVYESIRMNQPRESGPGPQQHR